MGETTERPALVDYRCPECSRLICKVSDVAGVEVEAVCPRQGCRKLVRAILTTPENHDLRS